jgi:hypothetical protein
MNKQIWPWLLLPLSLLPRMATAQGPRHVFPPNLALSQKQSHYELPTIDDLASAQETLPQRLQELHQLYEVYQFKDQVQELLKGPQFRKQMEKLSESDWQQLQEKMLTGKGLNQDLNWAQLLQQAASRKNWDRRQTDLLRRWAERIEHKPSAPNQPVLPDGLESIAAPSAANASGSSAGPPSLPTPVESEVSLLDQLQEETTTWLMEKLDDMDSDVLQALMEMAGSEENTPLAELLRSMPQPDLWRSHAVRGNEEFTSFVATLRSETFARYLSNVGNFLRRQRGIWEEASSLFRTVAQSTQARFGGPSVSVPASPAAGGDDWAPALLSLLMLGMLVLLLYRSGLGPKLLGSGAGAEWRLGPWPVPPDAVATRQDVVRAFEYLALLHLGPAAAACHHRLLAERLVTCSPALHGNKAFDPARRQAVEILAWLYEQARYAPDGETLSPEQLSEARHALCLLAGVTAV